MSQEDGYPREELDRDPSWRAEGDGGPWGAGGARTPPQGPVAGCSLCGSPCLLRRGVSSALLENTRAPLLMAALAIEPGRRGQAKCPSTDRER